MKNSSHHFNYSNFSTFTSTFLGLSTFTIQFSKQRAMESASFSSAKPHQNDDNERIQLCIADTDIASSSSASSFASTEEPSSARTTAPLIFAAADVQCSVSNDGTDVKRNLLQRFWRFFCRCRHLNNRHQTSAQTTGTATMVVQQRRASTCRVLTLFFATQLAYFCAAASLLATTFFEPSRVWFS